MGDLLPMKNGQMVLLSQGESCLNDDNLYVVQSGRFDVYRNGKLINRLKKGSFFGELSLITGGRNLIYAVYLEL